MNVKNYTEGQKKIGLFVCLGEGGLGFGFVLVFYSKLSECMFKTWYLLHPLLGTQKLPAACAKVPKDLLAAVLSNSYTLGSVLLT